MDYFYRDHASLERRNFTRRLSRYLLLQKEKTWDAAPAKIATDREKR